jgi:hypothetical protein
MKPYIGYAYTNGLTNGTSATTYSGTNTIRANQYIAFVLRALGYESGKDFEVSTSWELADELGVTDGSYNASTTTFTRGDVAKISLAAHEIQETVATAPYWGLSADIKWIAEPTTTEDFTNNVLYSFLMGNYSLNFTNYPIDNSDPETFVKTVRRQVKALCSKYTALMGVYYNATIGSGVDGDLLFIDFPNASLDAETIYQQQQTALKTAQQIKADLRQQGKITDSMSQLEIAQAYYDYLVSLNVQPGGGSAEAEQGKSVEYDSAYACLVNKKADCVGQVAAFNLLMHLEGISAMGVSGTYKASNSSILVSMVTLDGKTYYCDWSDGQPLTQDVSSWFTIN